MKLTPAQLVGLAPILSTLGVPGQLRPMDVADMDDTEKRDFSHDMHGATLSDAQKASNARILARVRQAEQDCEDYHYSRKVHGLD